MKLIAYLIAGFLAIAAFLALRPQSKIDGMASEPEAKNLAAAL